MEKAAAVWEEDVFLPTYEIGQADKNPMFFEKRVYQGSSGVVYPYPVIEKVGDTCNEKRYRAVFLENEYIKVMILPELGGRVQMAYDKLKGRHFVYYNRVVKPALVGLAGPWISGGIEFNWPQHHRPSTFLPVDYVLETRPDGSAAVWVSERERMFHQKGAAAFVLRPGRAVLEIQGTVSNPTPVPQTFLWWANPAVAVNENYQSVFPDDVDMVFDHGRRDVSRYPIATGTYYKVDYSAGIDLSRYRNIPVPTSFMAVHSSYDFVGGYEHDTQAGVLHVASHHVSPGKKQWTWGCGEFGRAWDRNLTDADGPYIELMAGVYTDNQPDFAWLQPYEEKRFTQYFIPYRELGVVKNASADFLLNLEPLTSHTAVLKVLATSCQESVRMVVVQGGDTRWEHVENLSPDNVFQAQVSVDGLDGVSVTLYGADGRIGLSWRHAPRQVHKLPEPAKAALPPDQITTNEQLYLTGLHLEQYRHATFSPVPYYEEAIRRDPGDVRCNNAMGLWLIRKGQFAKAEPYLRRAVDTLMERNSNPYDGEPLYNLGLCLKYQGREAEARDWFHKACWNAAWQDAAYMALAQIETGIGNWSEALLLTDRSLDRNRRSLRARHLKAVLLRHMGLVEEARLHIDESMALDPFNFGCAYEACLLEGGEKTALDRLAARMRYEAHNYTELLLDYAAAGLWGEALDVARWALSLGVSDRMMLRFYESWCLSRLGRTDEARQAAAYAEQEQVDVFFPNTPESILALQTVAALGQSCPKALYCLGNVWYDRRQYSEAVDCWEKSRRQDGSFPTVLRNLSLAYFNKLNRPDEALDLLRKAYALDPSDARILMELDQLCKRMQHSFVERLDFLDRHKETALSRDDLYLEYATLLNQTGQYRKAVEMIDRHRFHPWEGGEGKVSSQYHLACMELAQEELAAGNLQEALEWADKCFVYALNWGEGKLQGARENDYLYGKGRILEALGRTDEARKYMEQASAGHYEPVAAVYYNDQKPDKIFYQGLAFRNLGREAEARSCFNRLADFGERHLFDVFRMDYFAVSLPDLQLWEDDMDRRNRVHCLYLSGLGYWGLGRTDEARRCLAEAAALDLNHQGVQMHLRMLETEVCREI